MLCVYCVYIVGILCGYCVYIVCILSVYCVYTVYIVCILCVCLVYIVCILCIYLNKYEGALTSPMWKRELVLLQHEDRIIFLQHE